MNCRSILESRKFAVFLIIGIVFIVYANTFGNQFTNWDDEALILRNEAIRSLDFQNIKEIFSFKSVGTYQPVRVFSYALDYFLWGASPLGYHLHNTLLHGFAAVFLYLVLLKIIPQIKGMQNFDETAVHGTAFVTTLFFAVHPVNVEAVAWLSGRKYVLLSFFSFCSLYFFVINSQRKKYSVLLAGLSLTGALLAVFSSPFGIVLPLIFFLYEYCSVESRNPVLVFENRFFFFLPYVVFVVVAVPKLWQVLITTSAFGHVQGNPVNTLWTMLRVIFDYIRNLIFPIWLNVRYVDTASLSVTDYKVLVALTGLVGLFIIVVRHMKQGRKDVLFCVAWFLIFWLPVSNIVPISTKMADRYIYMASIGLMLGGVSMLFRYLGATKLVIGSMGILLIACSVLTTQRNAVWRNSFTLWEDSLRKDSQNVLALTNLGSAYFDTGQFKEAIPYFKAAAVLKPDHFAVHNNLGAALMKDGQLEEAVAEYLLDIKINPVRVKSHEMLAKLYERLGKTESAMISYENAAKLAKTDPGKYYNLASFCAANGFYRKAIQYYLKTIEMKEDYVAAVYDLGRVFHAMGKKETATKYYRKAIKIDASYPDPYNALGNIMLEDKRYGQAEKYYRKALEINPELPEAYYNLGNRFAMENDLDEALIYYKRALKYRIDYPMAIQMIRQIEQLKETAGDK